MKSEALLLDIGRAWGEFYGLAYADFHGEPGIVAWKKVVRLCDKAQKLAQEADAKATVKP